MKSVLRKAALSAGALGTLTVSLLSTSPANAYDDMRPDCGGTKCTQIENQGNPAAAPLSDIVIIAGTATMWARDAKGNLVDVFGGCDWGSMKNRYNCQARYLKAGSTSPSNWDVDAIGIRNNCKGEYRWLDTIKGWVWSDLNDGKLYTSGISYIDSRTGWKYYKVRWDTTARVKYCW